MPFHGVVEVVLGDHVAQPLGGDVQGGKAQDGPRQRHCRRNGEAALFLVTLIFAGEQEQPQGQQRDGNAPQVIDDHIDHHIRKIGDDTPCGGEHQGGPHEVEVGVPDQQLHHHHGGAQENGDPRKPAGSLLGQGSGYHIQQSSQAEGKAQQGEKQRGGEFPADPVVEQQLQVANRGDHQPAGQAPGFFPPYFPVRFQFVHQWVSFVLFP